MAANSREAGSPVNAYPVVVGANHKSASLTLRDALFMEDAAVPAFLESLRTAGLSQAMVISTCDRTEVVTTECAVGEVAEIITSRFAETAGVSPSDLSNQLYALEGEEALEHLFAVATSLDSLVLGEPQVLGQVKASHRLGRDAGMMGQALEHIMQAAFAVAKRVRSETTIGESAVSIAAAAVQVAREVHGDLGRCRALMIGAGKISELVAAKLTEANLGGMTIADTVSSRAEAMARRFECHVAPLDTLAAALADADIVLGAIGRGSYLVSAEMVEGALKRRRYRPVFLIDAAMPGDIDPAVERLDGVFLYDLNDLERIALEGRERRQVAAAKARAIVREEVAAFGRGKAAEAAVPALSALRRRFEEVRAEVLADHPRAGAEEVTRRLVNRLLHAPSEALRNIAANAGALQDGLAPDGGERPETASTQGRQDQAPAVEWLLKRLFDLDIPPSDGQDGSDPEEESE
ncbi:MAG: glutamyl-tRNA reductase [Alphaproteobacteria bacterium]